MIRIIAVLFVILLILVLLSKLGSKRGSSKGTRKLLKYCEYCKSYVTDDQKCVNEDFDHKDLD